MLRHDPNPEQAILLANTSVREVEMEVVFGTPSKNCAGAGICLISSRFPDKYKIPCPHAPAIIHFLPGGELVFRFRKTRITTPALRAYFKSSDFLVEEAFDLPKRLIQRWQLPKTQVPPGRYLLEEYSQEWRLYFPL
ncbi:MAG: hypothetical protein H6569_11145 [Lewinellaceae bacterium]|nr:hypothetical protein [Lewinellaceae bacterium]